MLYPKALIQNIGNFRKCPLRVYSIGHFQVTEEATRKQPSLDRTLKGFYSYIVKARGDTNRILHGQVEQKFSQMEKVPGVCKLPACQLCPSVYVASKLSVIFVCFSGWENTL